MEGVEEMKTGVAIGLGAGIGVAATIIFLVIAGLIMMKKAGIQ